MTLYLHQYVNWFFKLKNVVGNAHAGQAVRVWPHFRSRRTLYEGGKWLDITLARCIRISIENLSMFQGGFLSETQANQVQVDIYEMLNSLRYLFFIRWGCQVESSFLIIYYRSEVQKYGPPLFLCGGICMRMIEKDTLRRNTVPKVHWPPSLLLQLK